MTVDLAKLKAANAKRWEVAKSLKPVTFAGVATRLIKQKQRYITVQNRTGVPWFIIAVIHEREASQNFLTQLGQGDPLDRCSVHEPKGRGPFQTWELGAVDALVECPPHASRNQDWTIGGALTQLELYNGLGYFERGKPSPYIWAGTDQYVSGKFVRDGIYDPSVVDSQLGCAGLLKAMMAMDRTISFDGKTPPVAIPAPTTIPLPPVVVPIPPKPQPVAPAGLWGMILALFKSIFGGGKK